MSSVQPGCAACTSDIRILQERKEAVPMASEENVPFDPTSFEHIPVLLNECLEGLAIDQPKAVREVHPTRVN